MNGHDKDGNEDQYDHDNDTDDDKDNDDHEAGATATANDDTTATTSWDHLENTDMMPPTTDRRTTPRAGTPITIAIKMWLPSLDVQ